VFGISFNSKFKIIIDIESFFVFN